MSSEVSTRQPSAHCERAAFERKWSRAVRYLRFDVSVKDLPVVDVFEAEADLNKPVHDLKTMRLSVNTN